MKAMERARKKNRIRRPFFHDELSLVELPTEQWDSEDYIDATDALELEGSSHYMHDETDASELSGSDLRSMHPKVKAWPTDLENAIMNGSFFRGAEMGFSNISSCELKFSNFELASLVGSSISASSFHGANLRGVDMEYSELSRVDLSYANLADANLRGSYLDRVDFRGADLRGADLKDCIVHECQFAGCRVDDQTELPFKMDQLKNLGSVNGPSSSLDMAS